MTKNSARKNAIRKYMSEHPGLAYRAASVIVDAQHAAATNPYAALAADFKSVDELLADVVDGDMQLLDHELAVAEGEGLAFEASIPEITEGPIAVVGVIHDLSTLIVDEHEEFDGGTTVGEIRVEADVEWEACIFKADYYSAPDDVPWEVIDADWNDHYVRVSGTIRAELSYHYGADHGSQVIDDITLQGLEQLSHTATP